MVIRFLNLKIIIIIQLAVWVLIILDVPILRALVGFVYLTFIPGFIIIRILRLQNHLGNVEILLYTVGLSLSTIIFLGVIINFIYPFFGIIKPISTVPLIFTISIFILTLCVCCYISDKDSLKIDFINITDFISVSPSALFLYTLPFIIIIGTYLANFYNDHIVIMVILFIISIIPILISSNKFKLPALAIIMISISILYHRSLISTYLWGWDIYSEYYFAKLVMSVSYWNPEIYSNVNSLPVITLVAPIYSEILNISLIWVFKIIYPLIFSMTPLGLYTIYEKQTNDKIAFLSVFFFMSVFSFYGELPILPRQEIAEFFLVLSLSIMFTGDKIDGFSRNLLLIIFGVSIELSHYGIVYIYLATLIIVWLIVFLITKINSKEFVSKTRITDTYVLILIIFTFVWYTNVSESSVFNTILNIGNHISNSIISDFMNQKSSEGLNVILVGTTSWTYLVLKYLHLVSQLFIVLGIVTLIQKYRELKFIKEYGIFSTIYYCINILAIFLPFFASSITVTRLYQITLIFLSPFVVIGGIRFYGIIYKFFNGATNGVKNHYKGTYLFMSLFFTIFLLFNLGFVNEILKIQPNSISLNSTLDYPRFNSKEIFGAEWLNSQLGANEKYNVDLYADNFGKKLLNGYIFPPWRVSTFDDNTEKSSYNSFIYLRNLNVEGNIMVKARKASFEKPFDYLDIRDSLFYNLLSIYNNKIYANGGSEIYRRSNTKKNSKSNAMISLTFDDGDIGIYKYGFSLLKNKSIPGTVFYITEHLNDSYENPDDVSYINKYQLREMINNGWEIGSHSLNHPDFTKLSKSEIIYQATISKLDLERELNVSINSFSYPYSSRNPETDLIIKDMYPIIRTAAYGQKILDKENIMIPIVGSDISSYNETDITKWIDNTIDQNGWLILALHSVNSTYHLPSDGGTNLIMIADYIRYKEDHGQIDAVTVSEGWKILNNSKN